MNILWVYKNNRVQYLGWEEVGKVLYILCLHRFKVLILYQTLCIWLEMEFTSDIFFKKSVCADYSQTIFKNK